MKKSFTTSLILAFALALFWGGSISHAQDAKVQVTKVIAITEKGESELDKTGIVHGTVSAFKIVFDHPHAYELLKAPALFFPVGVRKEGESDADFAARCVLPKDYFVSENVIRLSLKKPLAAGTLSVSVSSSRLLPYKFTATIPAALPTP